MVSTRGISIWSTTLYWDFRILSPKLVTNNMHTSTVTKKKKKYIYYYNYYYCSIVIKTCLQNLKYRWNSIFSHISGITLLGVPSEIYNYGTQYLIVAFTAVIAIVIVICIYLPVFYELQLTSVYEVWWQCCFEQDRWIIDYLNLIFSTWNDVSIPKSDRWRRSFSPCPSSFIYRSWFLYQRWRSIKVGKRDIVNDYPWLNTL